MSLKIIQEHQQPLTGISISLYIGQLSRMVFIHCCILTLNKPWNRCLMASLLVVISILYGCNLIPSFSGQSTSFSDADVTDYAQTVLQIESQRQIAYQKIQQLIGQQPPKIACDRRETLQQLPTNAQKVAVEFCNNSKKIARDSGLTSSQFNAITEQAQSDNQLKQRIQNAIIELQNREQQR